MAQRRVSVRKTKEILRLKFEGGLGNHKIGRALSVSASTVWDTVARFQATGLTWPLPPEMGEAGLEARLYRRAGDPKANPAWVPDWARVQKELRRKHVTLRLLWRLCRSRHNSHYADVRIMPTTHRKAWSVAVPALLRSA